MSAECTSERCLLTNYNMAYARLGVVVLMTPLLAFGIAFAFLAIKGWPAYGMAAFLTLILVALWSTVGYLTWTIGLGENEVVLRRSFRLERRPIGDVSRVRVRSIRSQFTRSTPLRYTLREFEMRGGGVGRVLKPTAPVKDAARKWLAKYRIPVVD